MKTVLLTGANGFIGKHVLTALLRRGYVVHAIGRNRISGIDSAGVIWHSTNLLERDSVTALFKLVRPEGLIHLAWETKHGFYWNSSSNLEWLAASLIMMNDFSRFGGKRIVIAGSSAEYQWGSLDDLDEMESPVLPSSLYGASKNSLREVVEKWAVGVGLSWAWGRFFNVFGPDEAAARLLPRVICTLIDGKPLLFDSGALVRDFIHVADAAEAFVTLFQSEVQGPVNVASGNALSLHDAIAIVAEGLHANDLIHFNAELDPFNQPARVVANVARLRNEVGWQPQFSLLARLNETCEWWRLAKK